MNSPKDSRLFVLALVPVLAAALLFALRMNTDNNAAEVPLSPGIITPEDQGPEPLQIDPGDKDTTKIEYRNILFNRGSTDKAYGPERCQVQGLPASSICDQPWSPPRTPGPGLSPPGKGWNFQRLSSL